MQVPCQAMSDDIIRGTRGLILLIITVTITVTHVHRMHVLTHVCIADHPIRTVIAKRFIIAPVAVAMQVTHFITWNHGVSLPWTDVDLARVRTPLFIHFCVRAGLFSIAICVRGCHHSRQYVRSESYIFRTGPGIDLILKPACIVSTEGTLQCPVVNCVTFQDVPTYLIKSVVVRTQGVKPFCAGYQRFLLVPNRIIVVGLD